MAALAFQKRFKEGGAAMLSSQIYLPISPSPNSDPRTALLLGYSPWPAWGQRRLP